MPSRKLIYLLKMFPRFSETFILAELLELERRGCELEIYSLHRPTDRERHADVARLRAPVTYLPDRIHRRDVIDGVDSEALGRQLREAARSADPKARKRVLQAAWLAPRLAASGAGHVHAHFATSASEVARQIRRLGGPGYSLTAHAKDIFHESVRPADLRRRMAEARFVVTVSDYNRRHLARLAPEARIRRIYNGLDLERFAPRPADRTAAEDAPLLLAVGRLVEKKGFEVLVEACGLLRDAGRPFRCQIVGKGEREAAIRRRIEDLALGDRVELLGPLPREALLELLPRATLFAAPCVVGADGNRDGLPTVLIEAMAMGLPAISTPVTGIPELVEQERSGLLVPPGDPARLAAAIARLLDDPVEAARLARAGRRRVERAFDLRRNVAVLDQQFTEAIDAHRLPVH